MSLKSSVAILDSTSVLACARVEDGRLSHYPGMLVNEIDRPGFASRRFLEGFVVAIIGADGAGKSTIAGRLIDAYPLLMKYIYMGASTEASNVTLPTSRLLTSMKRRRIAQISGESNRLPPAAMMTDAMSARLPRGKIVKALGVINRIAEEWYRQVFVWYYTWRGYIVICDRHFLYEYSPDIQSLGSKDQRLSVRLHASLLSRFFPKPDLTVFLDAPPEVLYARKPEWTIEHLENQRAGIIEQGGTGKNFVYVDATQPEDIVFSDVYARIERFRANRAG